MKENWGDYMLSDIKRNKSLTFYQPLTISRKTDFSSAYSGGLGAHAISTVIHGTATMTNQFNAELNGYLSYFQQVRASDAANLDLTQANQAARQRGVYRAWQYEKADISMGGNGSENWSFQEQQDIMNNVDMDNEYYSRSGVRGAEGHHQKNAADHPEHQANPDNIKFYRSHKEHQMKGHQGNFQNETDAPMRDKDQMLKDTNNKRVNKNEWHGLKMAVEIGIGVGFTIGFAVELAKSGVTPNSMKCALAAGTKSGIETGILSVAGFCIGRTIGESATNAVEGVLTNAGIQISENLSKMCTMATIGVLTISIFSAYQFVKLKILGVATKDALIQVGKQALFSLSILAVSIAAQGICGGPAGIIVSTSIGIIIVTYSIGDIVHQRTSSESIRSYMINKCKPSFGGGI
ncbi:hypothetical protein [Pseudobutyrivibrio xylanivorans]|uniref:hypothetical protein n=1 Tax=Pseudobutyrivibrio xylanivorans TaxID=185007 RepID=UPI00142E9450|nr:hypothetical protein [Pseudobutyrivibrio xylanivorans]